MLYRIYYSYNLFYIRKHGEAAKTWIIWLNLSHYIEHYRLDFKIFYIKKKNHVSIADSNQSLLINNKYIYKKKNSTTYINGNISIRVTQL